MGGDTASVFTKPGIYFLRLHDTGTQPYPAWRYHDIREPILVYSTQEDEEAEKKGWKAVNSPTTVNPRLTNWHWDLVDMSPRQLCIFAQEEYGADLPPEAGVEKLIKAIWRLHVAAPENKDRVVLMAHTVAMNYDATQAEIKRLVATEEGETTREEFWA